MDPVPALGEHSTAILRELGRSDADIEQLRADGVI
ncbi:l-carnitine dehydratase/bile acid-inducible protein f [Burkholderia sp. TJI49]|nr:l-carnitine dehydratase/bile acid-inducible protein f [Burkholderia sp. TJI49]